MRILLCAYFTHGEGPSETLDDYCDVSLVRRINLSSQLHLCTFFLQKPYVCKVPSCTNDTQTQVHYESTSRLSMDRKSTPTRNTRATLEGSTNHRAIKTVAMVIRKMTTVRLEELWSSWKNVVHSVLIVHTVTGMAG